MSKVSGLGERVAVPGSNDAIVVTSRKGCRLRIPPMPANGGTITKEEYDQWNET